MIQPRSLGPILLLDLPVPRPLPPAHERLELRYGMTEVYDGPTGRYLGLFDTEFACHKWLCGRPVGNWYRLIRRLPQTLTFELTSLSQSIAAIGDTKVYVRPVRRAWSISPNPESINRGEHEPQ